MEFEHQLDALIFFHLEEHTTGRHLVQTLQEDDFSRANIAPPAGNKKSAFFQTMTDRSLEQFQFVFQELQKQARKILPQQFSELGELVAVDGSLIDAGLSIHWDDYRDGPQKAKSHIGFNLNCAIPQKLVLTDGKGSEHQFVKQILEPGQTGILDRGYQRHKLFDDWQANDIHFICRIKSNTVKTCLQKFSVTEGSNVFYDAKVMLGIQGIDRPEKPLRLVGYQVGRKSYWVATDLFDLTAEHIAQAYKHRWEIEKFFAWWKRYLRVYPLISRSHHGLMIQILSGLITYLLLAIYCHEQYNERVSIQRVRQLRNKIFNETRAAKAADLERVDLCQRTKHNVYASP